MSEDKEPIDPEIAAIARKYMLSMMSFENRETEDCPACDQHVDKLDKIGRCVYARPCGCRIWQGNIPAAWKDK